MSGNGHVTSAAASVEANKLTYRRWFEDVVSRGDLALADELRATGVGIARMEGGRIAEAWAAYDALGLMAQLGDTPGS